MPTTHLAAAFTIAHPGITSAIIEQRTMEHLDDLSPPWRRWSTGWKTADCFAVRMMPSTAGSGGGS